MNQCCFYPFLQFHLLLQQAQELGDLVVATDEIERRAFRPLFESLREARVDPIQEQEKVGDEEAY